MALYHPDHAYREREQSWVCVCVCVWYAFGVSQALESPDSRTQPGNLVCVIAVIETRSRGLWGVLRDRGTPFASTSIQGPD